MQVNLIAFTPSGQRKDVSLAEGQYIIGRQASAQIRVPLSTVSRQHCEVLVRDNTIRVRDLGSSNGTFVNDDRVQEAELHAGDVLTVGTFAFVVQINGHPASIQPPISDEEALMSTPPEGTKSTNGAETEAMDETVTRSGVRKGMASEEDSSIFDFDFDFENDDNPQL